MDQIGGWYKLSGGPILGQVSYVFFTDVLWYEFDEHRTKNESRFTNVTLEVMIQLL